MPAGEKRARGGAVRYRTIRVGTGRNRKVLRVAIVRKAGRRGGHTIAGTPRAEQNGARPHGPER